jgi:hypothetical protein
VKSLYPVTKEDWNDYEALKTKLKVLNALRTSETPLGFNDWQKRAAVSSKSLGDNLREFLEEQLVAREGYDYVITPKGLKSAEELRQTLNEPRYTRFLRRNKTDEFKDEKIFQINENLNVRLMVWSNLPSLQVELTDALKEKVKEAFHDIAISNNVRGASLSASGTRDNIW